MKKMFFSAVAMLFLYSVAGISQATYRPVKNSEFAMIKSSAHRVYEELFSHSRRILKAVEKSEFEALCDLRFSEGSVEGSPVFSYRAKLRGGKAIGTTFRIPSSLKDVEKVAKEETLRFRILLLAFRIDLLRAGHELKGCN
ncbi:hypothetical protein HYW53_00625 [Candidatus Giovannonibacteria bacterium]|nr:hypothetical protein [Candidatus Giovannonibacteria bacterium]